MNNLTVISSVPWTDTMSPLMAPAVLKASLEKHGINAIAFDLNAEVRSRIASSSHRDSIIKFFLTSQVDINAIDAIEDIMQYMVDRVLQYDPEWVALSLLTYVSQLPNKWLCFMIKHRAPHVKIVIGGPGCYSTLKSIDSYTTQLKSNKIIDHFVTGDGEQALVDLIKGIGNSDGINSDAWVEVRDLENLPIPNYDDYDWSLYNIRRVSIWGSRGCVRTCTFCDIHEHWKKYTWRSAESIFNEIKHQREKYGVNNFRFADSLVNGNQKEYRKLIRLLADYNSCLDATDKVRWTGFFILRPSDQMKSEDWEYTALSGAELLSVGVESFVDHIREHIQKKFTNKDLEFSLVMAKKYKLRMNLLVIVGYVTETEQDHQEQLKWIRDNQQYANDPVVSVAVGSGLGILPNTWLDRHKDELGIVMKSDRVYQDWERPEIGSTPNVRMRWWQETVDELKNNGFKPSFTEDNHMLIEQYIVKKYAANPS